mgnify:CR=1 FL=1|tara:strand:- start:1044 stop:1280 length:237 start_codon:yes stop_codon:yes gene_type:complete
MDGLIRKLVVGRDPKNAMAYYSGMRAGDGKVSAILQDEAYLHKFGKTRYLVYIESDEGTLLWKAVDDMPCLIEFDLDF